MIETTDTRRAILHCDAPGCAVRVDVGPAARVEALGVRLPTGWAATAQGHQCTTHAQRTGLLAIAA